MQSDNFEWMSYFIENCYPPGGEQKAATLIAERLPDRGQTQIDHQGNVLWRLPGTGTKLLVAAPLFADGLYVTGIDEAGNIRVELTEQTELRSIWNRLVVFESGRVGILRPFNKTDQIPEKKQCAQISKEDFYIDTGKTLLPEDVRLGETAVFESKLRRGAGDILIGSRFTSAGVCTALLEMARTCLTSAYDLTCVFYTGNGLYTVLSAISPDYVLMLSGVRAYDSLDGEINQLCLKIGGGPVLMLRTGENSVSPFLERQLVAASQRSQQPLQTGCGPRQNDITTVLSQGIGAASLCLPIRYMGTGAELIQERDCTALAKLLGSLVQGEQEGKYV